MIKLIIVLTDYNIQIHYYASARQFQLELFVNLQITHFCENCARSYLQKIVQYFFTILFEVSSRFRLERLCFFGNRLYDQG